jgi:hypothetical protein
MPILKDSTEIFGINACSQIGFCLWMMHVIKLKWCERIITGADTLFKLGTYFNVTGTIESTPILGVQYCNELER